MSWSWNDPIDETTDIFDASFVRQFWAAAYERAQIVNSPPTPQTLPEAGAYVSSAKAWLANDWPIGTAGPSSPTGHFQLKKIQYFILNSLALGVFICPGPHDGTQVEPWTSVPSWEPAYAFATLTQDELGIPDGFTRKYPKEFWNLTSGTLSDWSEAQAGTLARYTGNGWVYQWDGAAWVLQPPASSPDITQTQYQTSGLYPAIRWNFQYR